MNRQVARDFESSREVAPTPMKSRYLEALKLIERVHRRLLEVIKAEFDRHGRNDLNPVQALLIYNIGDEELSAGELKARGYYQGSNVSYNLKKLVEAGYVSHERSSSDRRAVRVKLTEKGHEVRRLVDALYERQLVPIRQVMGMDEEEFERLNKALKRLERFWTDQVLYRL